MTRKKKLDLNFLVLFTGLLCIVQGVLEVRIIGPDLVNENDDAVFNCTATDCTGGCRYQWASTVTNDNISSKNTDSTIRYPKIKRPSSGVTSRVNCTVTDDVSSKEISTTFEINFGPDPVQVKPNSGEIKITEEETLPIINCTATCNPQCAFEWLKEGRKVQRFNSILIFGHFNAQRDDAGSYTCMATNPGTWETKSGSVSLVVQYPPAVTTRWDAYTKELICTADGVPSSYRFEKWEHYVDGVYIRSLQGTQENNKFTYRFESLSYQDWGKYKCTVSNDIKSPQSSSIDPPFENTPLLVNVKDSYNVSKNARLSAVVTVYAIPTVPSKGGVTLRHKTTGTIFNDNITVGTSTVKTSVSFYDTVSDVDGQNITITIPQVGEEYFGTLEITLRNSVGSITTFTTLMPKGPPDPPSDLKISDVSHDEVTLTLKSGFFNGASQTFIVQYRTDHAGSSWVNGTSIAAGEEKNVSLVARIASLSPETKYQFRAYGYNVYAAGDYTKEIISATTTEVPFPVGLVAGAVAGTMAVVIVIVVICALWRCSGLFNRCKKAPYLETPKGEKDDVRGNEGLCNGEENLTYNGENHYENTGLKNGQNNLNQSSKPDGKSYSQENIYVNANNQQQLDDVGQPYMTTKLGPAHSAGSLVASDGYIDLRGGNTPVVEDAYAVSDIKIGGDTTVPEQNYVDMDSFKAVVNRDKMPLTRKQSKPQYSNVSKEIGLNVKQNELDNSDQDKTYVDMNTARSPMLATKMTHGGGGGPDDIYVDMNTSKGKSGGPDKGKGGSPDKLDGVYVSMNSDSMLPPTGCSNKPKVKSQYVNLRDGEGSYDNRPSVSPKPAPGARTSNTSNKSSTSNRSVNSDRDSMPSYVAPPPPGVKLPDVLEDDYMNLNVKASAAKFKK